MPFLHREGRYRPPRLLPLRDVEELLPPLRVEELLPPLRVEEELVLTLPPAERPLVEEAVVLRPSLVTVPRPVLGLLPREEPVPTLPRLLPGLPLLPACSPVLPC